MLPPPPPPPPPVDGGVGGTYGGSSIGATISIGGGGGNILISSGGGGGGICFLISSYNFNSLLVSIGFINSAFWSTGLVVSIVLFDSILCNTLPTISTLSSNPAS